MKKVKVFLAVAIMVLFSELGDAQHLIGSKHDFTAQTWNTSGEICIVCHTPHNANNSVPDSPLWNHSLSAVTTYIMYSSSSMDAGIGQPDGSSKLCLSCHDGTVGLENFNGVTSITPHLATGVANVGSNLSNDHPISIKYDVALSNLDRGLWDPTLTQSGIGGTITESMLSSEKLQCSSCHDVHNSANVPKLLVKSNNGSALCLTCHNK